MSYFEHKNYRKPKRTTPTLIQISHATKNAIIKHNFDPSEQSIAKLVAQFYLETGGGKYCWNYNLTNIKRNPKNGTFTMLNRVSEVINGHEVYFYPPHIQTCFAAYDDLTSGAYAWLNLLLISKRYTESRKMIFDDEKTPAQFAWQLGLDGFYTASKTHYSKLLQKLYDNKNLIVHAANAMRIDYLDIQVDELELKETIYKPLSDILKEIEEEYQQELDLIGG